MAGFAFGLGAGVTDAQQASQANLAGQQKLAEMQAQQAQTQSAQLQNQQLQDRLQALPKFGQMLQDKKGLWDDELTAFALQHQIVEPKDAIQMGYVNNSMNWAKGQLDSGIGFDGKPLAQNPELLNDLTIAYNTHDPSALTKYDPIATAAKQAQTDQAKADAEYHRQLAATTKAKEGPEVEEIKARTNDAAQSANKSLAETGRIPFADAVDQAKVIQEAQAKLADYYTKNRGTFHWGSTVQDMNNYVSGELTKQGFTPDVINTVMRTVAAGPPRAAATGAARPGAAAAPAARGGALPPGARWFQDPTGKQIYSKKNGKPYYIPADGGPPRTD